MREKHRQGDKVTRGRGMLKTDTVTRGRGEQETTSDFLTVFIRGYLD
jgi:hypothetical protein